MKAGFFLAPLLLSTKATANPIGGGDVGLDDALHPNLEQRAAGPAPPLTPPAAHPPPVPTRASDPPPAPTPLPPNLNGVLAEGTIINYNASDKNFYSCWNFANNIPTPGEPYAPGTCPVCVLQRNNNDGSADYQLWARDNLNNPIGNMQNGTTVFPMDVMPVGKTIYPGEEPVITMGGHPLLLSASKSSENPHYSSVTLFWATPPRDPNNPASWLWLNATTPQAMFDPGKETSTDAGCELYGTASGGAVIYFECYFDC